MKVVPSFPATEWAFIDPAGDGADVTEVRKIAELIGSNPVAEEVLEWVEANDKDGDYLLAADEMKPEFAAHFEEADTDKNGKIDVNEAITWYDGQWESAIHLHHLVDEQNQGPDLGVIGTGLDLGIGGTGLDLGVVGTAVVGGLLGA